MKLDQGTEELENKSELPQKETRSKKLWTLSCYSVEQRLETAVKQLGKRCLALSERRRQTAGWFGCVCRLIQAAQGGRWGPPSCLSNVFAGNRPWQEGPSRAGKFLLLSAKVELAGNPQICLPKHLFQSIPHRFFGFALEKARKTSVQSILRLRIILSVCQKMSFPSPCYMMDIKSCGNQGYHIIFVSSRLMCWERLHEEMINV